MTAAGNSTAAGRSPRWPCTRRSSFKGRKLPRASAVSFMGLFPHSGQFLKAGECAILHIPSRFILIEYVVSQRNLPSTFNCEYNLFFYEYNLGYKGWPRE